MRPITVEELIEHLQQFPKFYQVRIDGEPLTTEDVKSIHGNVIIKTECERWCSKMNSMECMCEDCLYG